MNRRSFFGLLLGAVAVKRAVKSDMLRSVFAEIESSGLYSSQYSGSAIVFGQRAFTWDEVVERLEVEPQRSERLAALFRKVKDDYDARVLFKRTDGGKFTANDIKITGA